MNDAHIIPAWPMYIGGVYGAACVHLCRDDHVIIFWYWSLEWVSQTIKHKLTFRLGVSCVCVCARSLLSRFYIVILSRCVMNVM